MVQKYQSPLRVYKYPFELIMAAYERRFPRCPQIPIVLDCTIVEDDENDDKSIQKTVRKCKLNVDAPYLIKKIIGVDHVFFVQTNVLNRRERQLTIHARNETFANRVTIEEQCRYFVHPENPDWTCFEQCANVDVKNFLGFENTIEKLGLKQYSQSIAKGKEIIDYFINELLEEGVTQVDVWQPPKNDSPTNSGDAAANGNGVAKKKDNSTQFQLEADYIARYLGELDLLQQSQLMQMKKCVHELLKDKVPNDMTLLRFLRARDFNVEKAREMLSQSLVWRKKYQVDKILSEYETSPVVKKYFPGGWHHCDKEGRPLYLLKLGQMDIKGILKSIGKEGLLKLALHVCEQGLEKCEKATVDKGKPISTWTLLVDLDGLNMRHLWRPGIKMLLHIIEIAEANYPETLGQVLIIRAPRVFPILWTLVGTFIDENTRSKFLVYAGNDYMQVNHGLVDFVAEDVMPDFLGGPCPTEIQDGQLVPKNLYMPEAVWLENGGCGLSQDMLYHSATIGKGHVLEVIVDNNDAESLLTWDFDVMRHDVAFTVYRIATPRVVKDPDTPTRGESHGKSIIDKQWVEQKDYFKVEPTLVCHDGESIQGSHVMSHVGTYLLQWVPYSNVTNDANAHKAEIWYFYEKLSSTDYRGSMTSLQSANSGFSALSSRSLSSSCPSR